MANKLRSILTVIGIALGVAIFLAIRIANFSAINAFQDSIDRVAGGTHLEVVSIASPELNEDVLYALTDLWQQHITYTPIIEETASIPLPHEKQETTMPFVVKVLGVDMLKDQQFRSYDYGVNQITDNPLELLQKDSIIVGAELATRYQLTLNDSINLVLGNKEKTFQVKGVLSDEGLGSAFGGNLVLMDIATAQEAYGLLGKISRVDILFENPTPQAVEALSDDLNGRLPGYARVQRPERRGQQVETMLAAYQYNLTVLSFISLLVGLFLIYNTMSITVIRRRPQIGLLRTLGFSRGTIFKLFMSESALFGIAGSVLGVGLGVLLAQGALTAISKTAASLYTGQEVTSLYINQTDIVVALLLGSLISLAGALFPVWEATQVSPAEATRQFSYERRFFKEKMMLFFIGIVVWGLAWLASEQDPINGVPVFGFISALGIILGGVLTIPQLLSLFLNQAIKLLPKQFRQTELLIALRSLAGALGRTSVAVISLMIGIAMMISLAIMIGSFRETVSLWVNQSLKADVWIKPAGDDTKRIINRIDPEIVVQIKNTRGIKAMDAFYDFPTEINGKRANIVVGDFDVFSTYGDLRLTDPRPVQEVLDGVMASLSTDSPQTMITESLATHLQLKTGDTITLPTPSGNLDLIIAGVYYDYSSDLGYLVLPRRLYKRCFKSNNASGLAIYLNNPDEASAFRDTLQETLPANTRLSIVTNAELRNQVLTIFDNTFAITYALHAIAILVALLCVTNSLFALVLENKREFGILKYLGTRVSEIRLIIMYQASVLAVSGSITGLFVGYLLSLLLIFVINKQSFGWSIFFSWPSEFIAQSFVLILITALLSALYPAYVASKIQAPSLLRDE